MKWSSAGNGTEARHAQSPTKIDEDCPRCSISRPLSRRQAPVESESLPEICSPVPGANSGVLFEKCHEFQESHGVGTRGCASSRQARWCRSSAQVVPGRQHHRLRNLIDHPDVSRWKAGRIAEAKSCEGTLNTAESSNRSWQVPLSKEARNVKVNDARHAHPTDCFVLCFQHHNGSQLLAAAVMALWPSFSLFGSQPTAEGIILVWQRITGKEIEGSCFIGCAASPMLACRDPSWTNAGLKGSTSSCPDQSVEVRSTSSEISSTLPQRS